MTTLNNVMGVVSNKYTGQSWRHNGTLSSMTLP